MIGESMKLNQCPEQGLLALTEAARNVIVPPGRSSVITKDTRLPEIDCGLAEKTPNLQLFHFGLPSGGSVSQLSLRRSSRTPWRSSTRPPLAAPRQPGGAIRPFPSSRDDAALIKSRQRPEKTIADFRCDNGACGDCLVKPF